jgi:hypothetical protein
MVRIFSLAYAVLFLTESTAATLLSWQCCGLPWHEPLEYFMCTNTRCFTANPTPFGTSRIKASESGLLYENREDDSPRISNVPSGGLPSSPPSGRLTTELPPQTMPLVPRNVPVMVDLAGPGMFKLTATPDVAGTYVVRAGVNSLNPADTAFLQMPVDIRAAELSPEHCTVTKDESSCTAWVAGGTAKIVVQLADRFGNRVNDVDASQLDVSCSGPGRVTHTTNYGSRGKNTVIVKLTARSAGRYEVQVRDRLTGKSLGGPPVVLTLMPADLNPRMSTFQIRGWQVTGGQATATAGSEVQLALAIYDIYGNPGIIREEGIVAHASGPGGVVSAKPVRAESQAGASPDEAVKDVHVPIVLKHAGLYRLAVEVRNTGGQVVKLPPFQGHETLQLLPAPADPIKTAVQDWPADGKAMPTGVTHTMTIVPCDSFGNPGAGGAGFIVRLKYPSGDATPVPVTPSGDGCGNLVASITPKVIGTPTLQILCTPAAPSGRASTNGVAPQVQTFLVASKDINIVAAGTSASQCFLSSVWPEQGGVVGMPAGMLLTSCDGQGNPRREGGDRFVVDIPGLPKYAPAVALVAKSSLCVMLASAPDLLFYAT